jgi:hypothetical protein
MSAPQEVVEYLEQMDATDGSTYPVDFRDGFRHALAMLDAAEAPVVEGQVRPIVREAAREALRRRPATGDARRSVMQEWVSRLPMMQQTVLLTAVRGPDGLPKYHPAKFVLRWYRRCILLSALDGKVLTDPADKNGGSFTGPSVESPADWPFEMDLRVTEYLRSLDEVPHHFQMHLMHAVEILGYKHPDEDVRGWWHLVYLRLVHDMHLWPETEAQLDQRLGDSREGWLARGDVATND